MSIHRIKLRGPWDYTWLTDVDGNPSPNATEHGRVTIPVDWRVAFGDRAGRVRFLRRFHQPTGVEVGDHVWLSFLGLSGQTRILLDDLPLTGPSPRFEITDQLRPTNRLVVELECDPRTTTEPLGLHGLVVLEIEST